jgi:sugar lactone lactonase YvrE
MVNVPASQPSCIAFGGPEMSLLFVTSARDGLKDDILLRQPSAGNLFVYRTDITGLPDADFIFDQAT